jgi:hypothetical protein
MADLDGSEYVLDPVAGGTFGNLVPASYYGLETQAVAPPVDYFKMRGVDTTCPAGQQPAYVYWTVQDEPDTTAAFAMVSDLICGTDPLTDIDDISVAHTWTE